MHLHSNKLPTLTLQITPPASIRTTRPWRLYRERIAVHCQASALKTRCRFVSAERGGTYISHWAFIPAFLLVCFVLPHISASILLSPSSLPYIFHSHRHSWQRSTPLSSSPQRFIKVFHFILLFFDSTLILTFLRYLHHLSVYTLYIIFPVAYSLFPHHILRIFLYQSWGGGGGQAFILPPCSLSLGELVFLKCLFQFFRETVSHWNS